MHDAAQHGVFQVRVQVDETGQQRRLAIIGRFLVGIAQLEHGGGSDVADNAVANEHGAVVDGLRSDGKHVLRAQKHGWPRLFRDLQVNTYDSTDAPARRHPRKQRGKRKANTAGMQCGEEARAAKDPKRRGAWCRSVIRCPVAPPPGQH